MKQTINLLMTCLLLFFSADFAWAQAPQKFNYQGIARDAKGNPMAKQQLSLKLTVLPAADATAAEYEETQLVSTNEFGLYTLQIGNGTATLGDMKSVKWETGNKYIKVAIDPTGGSNYVDAGTTQLLSVPYALYADKAGETAGSQSGNHTTRTGAVSSAASHVAGDANYLSKFTALNTIGKSQLYDNGTNIGIGTASPSAKFHLNAASGVNELRVQSNGGSPRLSFFGDNSTSFTSTANYALMYKRDAAATGDYSPGFPNSKLFIFGNAQGSLLFNTNGNIGFGFFNQAANTTTTRMLIDSVKGNVGIGTTAPIAKLNVNTTADSAIVSNANISKDSASGNTFLTNSNAASNMTFGAVGQVTGGDYGAGLFGRGFGYTFAPFTTRDMGLYGSANWSNTAIGVLGSSSNGTALMGLASTGIGAYLKAPSGTALLADSGNAIVNNGYLGVGTTPGYKFHSKTPGGYSGYFESGNLSNWVGFANSDGYDCYLGNWMNASSAFDVMTTNPNTDLNLGANYYTRLKIKTDGKIGIGTETPRSQVEISQSNEPILTITEALPTSGDTMSIDFLKPNNVSGSWTDWRVGSILLGGDFVIQTSDDDFATSPTTRMKISPYGGVTINDGLTLNISGAAQGTFLASDAAGNATWKSTSTGVTYSGYGLDPTSTTAMLTPANSFTITSSTQKVFWTASKAFGSTIVGGASGLNIFPAYNNTATPATINLMGGGIYGLQCPQNTRNIYSISGFISGLAPGTYSFGMAGSCVTTPANWNNNEWGYVTVMVME